MPNWCQNDLTITGDKVKEVLAFIAAPGDGDEDQRVFDFDKVIPYPDKLKALDQKAADYSREISTAETDKQRAEIRLKYGMELGQVFFKDGYNSGGYEWCVEFWGTKWNASSVQILEQTDDMVKLTFDTAWSPPIPVISKLGEKFPSCYFMLEFFECGMGFQGVLNVENGQPSVSYDDYDGERGG